MFYGIHLETESQEFTQSDDTQEVDSNLTRNIVSVHDMSDQSKRRCKELIIELINVVLENHSLLRMVLFGIVKAISNENISIYVHKVIQHEKISNLPDKYNDDVLIDFIEAFSFNIVAIPKSIHQQIHTVHSTLSHETKTIAWQYIKGIHMLYYQDVLSNNGSDDHAYDEDE
jgi:translation elongation factor EF-Ts